MARRRRRNRRKTRSTSAFRTARRRVRRSLPKRGARGRFIKSNPRRRRRRSSFRLRNLFRPRGRRGRFIKRRNPGRNLGFAPMFGYPALPPRGRKGRFIKRRNPFSKSEKSAYRKAIKRYGYKAPATRSVWGTIARRYTPKSRSSLKSLLKNRMWRRRNPMLSILKQAPMMMLRAGGGLVSSMLAGYFAGQVSGSEYGPVLGSVLVLGGSVFAQMKFPQAAVLGHEFTAGAGAGAYYALMNLLIQKGFISAEIARFVAPWAIVVSPEALAPQVGTGAFVQQAALYGMGASPLESAMRHRLHMLESGMSGGIFDSKTTLGEYDLLETAPHGTSVQSAMAEYVQYPPLGATVEQATAGLGATVQEAFAGPSLREYVSVPLSDYVGVGGGAPSWSQSHQGRSVLTEIQGAARKITAERARSGMPVDANFVRNLTAAAQQAVQGGERDVSMAAAVPPLTRMSAPFPGQFLGPMGGVAGQPAMVPVAAEYMEEDDAGIFG